MRQLNHIVLDFENKEKLDVSWASKFVGEKYQYSKIFSQVSLLNKTYLKQNSYIRKKISKKYKYKFFTGNNKMTFIHSDYVHTLPKPLSPRQRVLNSYLPTSLVSDTRTLKLFLTKKSAPTNNFISAGYLKNDANILEKKSTEEYLRYYTFIYRKLYVITSNINTQKQKNINVLNKLVILNFIKKERLYTKLKYSRSPAYDIVSGGAAALLAGFLGFLISEKYGFELADSGDFYFLFMYAVFFCFSFRPLVMSISSSDNIGDIFSLRFFLDFYFFLIYFFFRKR